METLEKSRMCRLCGKQSGIAVDIFDKNESHVRKINAILPILVHEMDLLPKQMCHRCSYKLEEFYNFYVDCAKADSDFKSQLSWMRKEELEEKIVTPMVKMNRFKIKTEPPDNSDSINSGEIHEHISENSLLFPASIVQHSIDLSTRPVISCSRCRCLCNKSIKANKQSRQQVKPTSNSRLESLGKSISSIPNISNKVNESNESRNEMQNSTTHKSLFERECLRDLSAQKIAGENINDCNKSNNINNNLFSTSDKLNRALRPRKGSVDYTGPKKKGLASNLKTKFKNKLDLFNPTLVSQVNIKISQNNSIYSSPVIKLEKVDDTMRILRTRKNLEEFNKRIKEFQIKKKLNREDNHKNRSFYKERSQVTKIVQIEENQNRKSLQREERSIRKSLREEIFNRKSLQSEDIQVRNNLSIEHQQIKESNGIRNQELEVTVKDGANQDSLQNLDLKIKQEFHTTRENKEPLEVLAVQRPRELNSYKNHQIDRFPLCAVVKLENDYTCNVDYPRIKIKRHLAVANSSKADNDLSVDANTLEELQSESVTVTKIDDTNSKHLRSKEKTFNINNNKIKTGKISKKKSKHINVNDKQINTEENLSSVTSQTNLKRYCEECDTCFRNKELFQLHPCYQK